MATRFGVWNEYGRLREVAVGTTDGIVVPSFSPAYPPEIQALTRAHEGKPLLDVEGFETILQAVQAELDHLAETYRRLGVIVHRPRPYTDAERDFLSSLQRGAYQLYPADPIWIIGRHAIECQFRQPVRNKEVFPLRELIAPLIAADADARVAACPMSAPLIGGGGAGPRLEGGDIFICGNDTKDILVGIDEERSSSAAGVEWLGRYLYDDGYRVTGVPITRDAPIHLLGALGAVGPECALIYRPSLLNGIPKPLRTWDLIDITLEEAKATGPCLVMIDPQTILVPAQLPRIAEELAKRSLEVIPIPFASVSRFDGGIRCATFVMRRDA
ncbi:hypothetical protein [uncultured Thiodictyon sp.]|uniref:dimethylarginine dimethylaminohydrolase family protein n=1 Tax=uncultured Thiodictyon sp. TaxID=1846217 RepID=UPI0025DE92C6|nr:hypothetical protein [uncultured Thiodictyon sp.]